MSDLLAQAPLGPNESYISGYPLKHSHKYVVARTWAGPKDGRAGSVWTQSLLLDYSVLARLHDVSALLSAFRRPSEDDLVGYDSKIFVGAGHRSSVTREGLRDERVRKALAMMYGKCAVNSIVLPSRGEMEDETLAVFLWRQMWPSLRRNFVFSTRGDVRQLSAISGFTLSFRRGAVEQAISGAESAPEDGEGLERLFTDLARRGPTRLRRFLGVYAYDSTSPRTIVPALAMIDASRSNLPEVLRLYELHFSGSHGLRRLRRDIFLACVRDNTNSDSLKRALRLVGNEPADGATEPLELAVRDNLLLRNNAGIISEASRCADGSVGGCFYLLLSQVANLETLTKASDPGARPVLLDQRPEAVRFVEFWNVPPNQRGELLAQAISRECPAMWILAGLGSSASPEELARLVDYDKSIAVNIFQTLDCSEEVLASLVLVPGFIAGIVSSSVSLSLQGLEKLARATVSSASTRWCTAAESLLLIGRAREKPTGAHPYLSALSFRAALGATKAIGFPLLEAVFDAFYDSMMDASKRRVCATVIGLTPQLTKKQALEYVFDVARARYAKEGGVDARIYCISERIFVLEKVGRSIRKELGTEKFRESVEQLNSVEALQVPRRRLEEVLVGLLPLFSKPVRPKSPRG